MSSPPLDIAVIGGGISGLAAAYELQARGLSFAVFERSSRFGGVILTEYVDGFTVDAGPDSLLIHKPAAVRLCRELGLGDRLIAMKSPRTAFVLRHGKLLPIPEFSVLGVPTRLTALATSPLFSLIGKTRMAMDLVIPRPKAPRDDESIESLILRRFGREAVTYLAEPLLAGIHAGDAGRLSVRALFPRLAEAEARHGSLIRAFRASSHPPPRSDPGDEGDVFLSLTGGLQELVDKLQHVLPRVALRPNAQVVSVNGQDPFVIRVSGGDSVTARAVLLAVPAYVAADLVVGYDGELASLCRQIPYASTATVALAYSRASVRHRLQGSGFLVPPREDMGPVIAVTWISSKWPGRAPEGSVLLRAFVGGPRHGVVRQTDDPALVRTVQAAVGRVLHIDGPPLWWRVYRWDRATPQYEVGHLARIDDLDRRLQIHPGLYITGSGFRGVGIPDCIADGRASATAIAEWLSRRAAPVQQTS